MKLKSLLIIIVSLTAPGIVKSQKSVTLKECYDKALIVNSLANDKQIYNSIWELRDENISKNWLPSLDANGSFVYNSSVIDLSNVLGTLPIPGIGGAIKPLPHEQYRITLDINQVIFDGGATKNARALEKADRFVSEKQTESDLYKLKGQINTYYFNLLIIERQKELSENYLDLIKKKISALESALNNGIISKPDIDVLTSEKIRLDQRIREIEIMETSLLKILSDLTGITIDASSDLILPAVTENGSDDLSRPELQLFDLRIEQLEAGMKLSESKRMPKAFGFATLGYGNPPGNNFFKDEFAPYYILGAGVKWNIFDWNRVRNEKQVISLQQDLIKSRKKDLDDNLKRLLVSKNAEIAGLRSLLDSDSELIAIRKRITAATESQYSNGTVTATEYLNAMNSEREAMISNEIHKINLVLAQIEYLNISGKEIE